VRLGEGVQSFGHLGQGSGKLAQLDQAAPAGRDPQLGQGVGGLGQQLVQLLPELVGTLVGG
jgi:hypothetical protein